LRLQTRAYLLAHGSNPDAMSEDDFNLVMVAINDGFIGNKVVLNTLGLLTTGVFNYIRSMNSQAYTLQNVIGLAYDYIYRPLTDEQKAEETNQRLLMFMQMMPGAEGKLKNG
jgi:hypothetical protein